MKYGIVSVNIATVTTGLLRLVYYFNITNVISNVCDFKYDLHFPQGGGGRRFLMKKGIVSPDCNFGMDGYPGADSPGLQMSTGWKG